MKTIFISKRAKIIELPENLLNEIFDWAKTIWARFILNDKTLIPENPKEKIIIDALLAQAKNIAAPESMPSFKIFKFDSTKYKYTHLLPETLFLEVFISKAYDNVNGYYHDDKIFLLYHYPYHTFNLTMNKLKDLIAHELIHFLQDKIKNFGLPKKELRNPFFLPTGKPKSEKGEIFTYPLPHDERDNEFYSILSNESRIMERWLKLIYPEKRMKAFKTFIDINPEFSTILMDNRYSSVKPSFIFRYFKNDKKKWRQAIIILYMFLKKEGLL